VPDIPLGCREIGVDGHSLIDNLRLRPGGH
jgi:hypothetical protein